MSPHELKALSSQIAQLEAETSGLQSQFNSLKSDIDRKNNKLKTLKASLAQSLKDNEEPVISEHAILRYLERVKGVDLDVIRSEILDTKTTALVKFTKSGKIKKDNLTLVLKNNVIITIET